MFRKLVLYFSIPFALAGTFASLGAGLAACARSPLPVGEGLGVGSPAPAKTVTPTFTPTLDFLHMERIPGLDPLTFAGQGEATTGEKYSLPQDVFSEARSRHLAPIEAEGGIASGCTSDSCMVMLTKYLVNGAQLQPATDGKVIYGLDGQAGSEALFRFSGLPEGVKATAFVAQEGNPWGFKAGMVVVWFWEGGSKGPARILNQDNPLQIMADKPNSISLTAIDNGLQITRIGPDGTVIDEQRVAFLPPLPELPQGTGEIQFVDGGYHYLNVELDKNVVVKIVEYTTTDGEAQRWITPADHLDWPLFIENEDGSWREAMVYVEVTKRLIGENGQETPFLGEDLIDDDGDPFIIFSQISPVVVGEAYLGQEGYLRVPVAVPFDGNPESPMVRFNLVLGHPESSMFIRNPFSGKQDLLTRANITKKLETGTQIRFITLFDFKDKNAAEIHWNSIKNQFPKKIQDYTELSRDNLWQNTIIIKALRDGEFVDALFRNLEIWEVVMIDFDF